MPVTKTSHFSPSELSWKYCPGLSARAAAGRIFDHHHTTITGWIERCGQHSERLHERLFHQALSIGHLQLDELVTKMKQDAERSWVWTAVAAQSKLILATHIGRRSSADAHQLLHQVWQRLAPVSLPIFTSDGLNQYFYGITAHFGTFPRIGYQERTVLAYDKCRTQERVK